MNIAETVQKRVSTVLERMLKMVNDDADNAEMFVDYLDGMLDDLQSQDAFGTEGQCDPRGDQRNGEFHMENVEGVDE